MNLGGPTGALSPTTCPSIRPISQEMERAIRLDRSHYAIVAIVAAGAIIRFATLDSQGYWFDEYQSVVAISQSLSGLLSRILTAESNPPLYYLAAEGWTKVFGVGEFGLRSLSAVAGTATIVVAYMTGLALGSRRAGLFAGALTATSPFMIWYSQEARSYALFALFASLAFLAFVNVVQGRDRRWLWAWAIASILAFGTHYFGFLLTGIEAIWLLWRIRGRRTEIALSIGVVAAAAVPLIPLAAAQRGHAIWIPALSRSDRLLQIPQHFMTGLNSPWAFLPPLAIALVIAVLIYALARPDRDALRIAVIPGVVALVAIAIPMVAGNHYLLTRNLIGTWGPFVIALGALLAAPRVRAVGTATVIALCLLGATLAIWNAATPAAGRPDWDSLMAGLGPATAPRLIEYQSSLMEPLVGQVPSSHVPATGSLPVVKEIDTVALRTTPNYSVGPCWWVGFCGGKPVLGPAGTFNYPVPAAFKLVDGGQNPLFAFRRYVAARPVRLPPVPGPFPRVIVQAP